MAWVAAPREGMWPGWPPGALSASVVPLVALGPQASIAGPMFSGQSENLGVLPRV